MKTIESLIEEANAKGLWLNNLYQLRTHPASELIPPRLTGQWQANFHAPTDVYEFGRGDSAIAALEDALRKVSGAALAPPVDPFS